MWGDAVFVGGQAYGLRSKSWNFTMDESEGIEYTHARGVMHVVKHATHEGNEQGAGEWFRITDINWCRDRFQTRPWLKSATYAPDSHSLKFTVSATNVETLPFLKEYGLTCVVLARGGIHGRVGRDPVSVPILRRVSFSHVLIPDVVPFLTMFDLGCQLWWLVLNLAVGNTISWYAILAKKRKRSATSPEEYSISRGHVYDRNIPYDWQ